jgi:ABC transport system ATP-binding/permease protein
VPYPLLSCEEIAKAYGARPLFTGLTLSLLAGDRVGLIGPNGSGKSTLLRILAGFEEPDHGTRSVRRGVRVGYVAQDPVLPPTGTVAAAVREAAAASVGVAEDPDVAESRAGEVLGRAGFLDPQQDVATLSGGWRKRLAICRELARGPEVLLFDEPTNHLDVEGILWLEGLVQGASFAYLAVSHDRYFLENVATRMLELNQIYPNGLFEASGSYSDFLVKRDELLANQAEYQASLANRVRREVAWLRQGAKARSTKAKARIASAEQQQRELAEIKSRAVQRTAGIDFAASGRKTKKLLVATGLVKALGGRRVLDGVDLAISPGQRLGLLGANGSGKTTLLGLLAGTQEPDDGVIERAPFLRVVRFEQDRGSLDPDVTLRRALAPAGDAVIWQDRSLHVAAWASRFLFRGEQLDMPVGRLSGGEQARVLIARLMLQPADLLLLDEPTNDLDIPTLEVLEESLAEFPGGLVLVTHDRLLLGQVATSILALDGEGGATPYADYPQWEAGRRSRGTRATSTAARTASPGGTTGAAAAARTPPPEPAGPRRLSYRENKEWEAMEGAILAAEELLAASDQAVRDPAVATDAAALAARCQALDAARSDVERLYARWAELEAKRGGTPS